MSLSTKFGRTALGLMARGTVCSAARSTARTVLALGVVLSIGACQDMFVYYPSTESEEMLLRTAAGYGLEPWPEAGPDRIGWRSGGPADSAARLLVFHGNGGHSLHRHYFARGFGSLSSDPNRREGDVEWTVYLLEYPGYGSRDGEPSEEALVAAADAAVERLRDEDPDSPIYLLGESLGSGVATQIAARNPELIPGVLLITPFTNLVEVGMASFPGFLVHALLRDRYDSEAALEAYDGRVGVRLAGNDEVVPAELGRRLYDGYDGPKRLWVQENASHNTLDYSADSPWWREASEFLLTGN